MWSLIWILIIKIRTNIYLLLVTYFTDENSLIKSFLTRFYYWSNQLTNLETLKVSDLTKQSKINQSDISSAFVLFLLDGRKWSSGFLNYHKTKSIIILTLKFNSFSHTDLLLEFSWIWIWQCEIFCWTAAISSRWTWRRGGYWPLLSPPSACQQQSYHQNYSASGHYFRKDTQL